MRLSDLRERFEQLLEGGKKPHRRGRLFEDLIRDQLQNEGYRVTKNPKGARPRQTDLIAKKSDLFLLVEVKWEEAKVDIDGIDSLRSRLDRMAHDVIGLFVSMSEYTKTAVDDVESRRQREIALISPTEVNGIFQGRLRISELVARKRDSLRIHGRNLFVDAGNVRPSENIDVRFTLPEETFAVGRKRLPYVSSAIQEHELLFSREFLFLPIDRAGRFSLSLSLQIETIADLKDFFASVQTIFGWSASGSFEIYQQPLSWHGLGVQAFLDLVADWKARYRKCGLDSHHHSEELGFLDQLDEGVFSFSGRQRVGDSSFLHSCELNIRLNGIPLFPEKLRRLCEITLNPEMSFIPISEEGVSRVNFHRTPEVYLKEIGRIHSTRFEKEPSVSGVIVENPFYETPDAVPSDDLFVRQVLSGAKIWICDLKDWVDVGTQFIGLHLRSVQLCVLSEFIAIHPSCSWDDTPDLRAMRERAKNRKPDNRPFEQVVAEMKNFLESKNVALTKRKKKSVRRDGK